MEKVVFVRMGKTPEEINAHRNGEKRDSLTASAALGPPPTAIKPGLEEAEVQLRMVQVDKVVSRDSVFVPSP